MTTIYTPEFVIPAASDLGPDPEPLPERFAVLMEIERGSRRPAVIVPINSRGDRPDLAERDAA